MKTSTKRLLPVFTGIRARMHQRSSEMSFEFSPDVSDDMLEVVRIFEQNHYRNQIKESALSAFDLVTREENRLTEKVKSSWRWRIFYLRALIDKEMFERKGKLEGETLKNAFDELTRIYHARMHILCPLSPRS